MPLQEIPLNAFINSDTEDGIPIPAEAPNFDEKNSISWNGAISNSFRDYTKGLYFYGTVLDLRFEAGRLVINGTRLENSTALYNKIDSAGRAWVYDATHVIYERNNELRYGELENGRTIKELNTLQTGINTLYTVACSQTAQTYLIFAEKSDSGTNGGIIRLVIYNIVNNALNTRATIDLRCRWGGGGNLDIRLPSLPENVPQLEVRITELSASVMTNGYLIIGCKTGSILTSFSVVLNSNPTVLRVIMGYGAVHPSGDLYGNILPSGLVNAYGLKTVIENNNIYYKIPSTSLVSHMRHTGSGNYSRVTIGLNNKVAGERLSLLQSGNNFIYSYSWDDEDAPWFAWPWGKAIVTATAGELIYGIRNTAPVLTDMLAKTYRVRTGASASFNAGFEG